MKRSAVRRIDSIELSEEGEELRLIFRGNGFLYNMVRILTGTLLSVGTGALSPDSIPAILASGRRENAGPTVPARGLILWDEEY